MRQLPLILLLMGSSALAQTPTVVIEVNRSSANPIDTLRQKTDDVAGATEFLSAADWADRRAITLKDMVDFTPGIVAQARNGAESMRLSVRGSGLTRTFQGRGILLLQDGVPINTADGSFEFNTIDPWLISNMQILKGANALEQGATQLGGSINMITPTGRDNGYGVRLEGGPDGHQHHLIRYGFADGAVDGFIAATWLAQDGYRRNNGQESTRITANFGWQTTDQFEQRLFLTLSHAEAQIPGTLNLAEIAADPRRANPANVAGRFRRDVDLGRVAYRGTYTDGLSEWQGVLYASYRDLDTPVTVAIQSQSRETGVRLKYGYGLRPNRFTAGLNVYYGLEKEKRFVNSGGVATTSIVRRDLEALTTEAYAQYEHLIAPHTTAIAGLQAASVQRNIAQHFPTTEQRDHDFNGLSPRLGLRYEGEAVTIFGSLSRSYEPPTLSELSGGNGPGFNSLDDQSATTLEVGARGKLNDIRWQAAVYNSEIDGEYIILRQPDGSSEAVNANRTRHSGIELGAGGRLSEKVSFNAAYTYSRFRFRNDPVYGDNVLPGAPEHYLRAELGYDIGPVTVTPNVEWPPQGYPVDMANSLKTEGYTVWGLRANWKPVNADWSVYADLRNLTDETYVTTTNVIANAFGNDGRHFYPGEGRALYVGISYKSR
ncbi:TonB-dependent receptor family protein [Asticcacaulis endophyticus]|uniref:TonB-dependent receptor n=1 Tax=Asticcacaulis endophyticus TaxID=1395890 RepID=A0A918PW08_9CAUL|nr:TonB-dependent receptor [Asticcacaulis endophyticus]GGZ24802.1 TonB-dependent receptor [Asticcacaulis endophyticus]